MTAVSPTTAPSCAARPLTADIDASTRVPILLMAFHSALWLIVALLAAFISSLKLHVPTLLSGWSAFTYGRLVAVADSVFIFGFASQAAMAVALWLICRLGATRLIGRGAATVGALFWNLGVLVGLGGILSGDITPFEHLQFPQYAISVLLIAFLIYAVAAILTFANRNECSMYPSLWFILAGVIIFPWVLATVMMTLWSPAIRSSVTPIIAAWAANQVITIWLGSIALAAVFYFLPKLTGRALYSNALAIFAFWLYLIFGQSTGMHFIAAVPAWVQGLSEFASLLMLVPVAACVLNWRQTVAKTSSPSLAYKYASWASLLFLAFGIVAAIGSLTPVRHVVQFTLFQTGLTQLFLIGFVTIAFFGAFDYILPRVVGIEWPRQGSAQFNLLKWGGVLVFAMLLIGGILQGTKGTNASTDFVAVVRGAIGPVGGAQLGYLLLIGAQFLFLKNLGGLLCAACCPKNGRAR